MRRLAQSQRLPIAVTAITAVAMTVLVVYWYGWVSDDAMITFRYAANLLAGRGPVYNAGEQVQGYTHPLWMFLLSFGLVFTKNPLIVSVVFGGALTFATLGVFGYTLARRARDPLVATLAILIMAALFASSEAWRSFQTSGLENSLTHFFIALLVLELFRERTRPFWISLFASLVVVTRPDLTLLVAPLGLVALYEYRTREGLLALVAGTTPVLLWLAFALVYYGTIVPNTANAKIGVYASLGVSIDLGWAYFSDWLSYEPAPAAMAAALTIIGAIFSRRRLQLALVAGGVLYVAYVIGIGGDFMRGRLIMAAFVTAVLFGTATIAQAPSLRVPRRAVFGCGAVILAVTGVFVAMERSQDDLIRHGIVNERVYYERYHLTNYISTGRLLINGRLAKQLQAYEAACGEVSIHAVVIGALGYQTRDVVDVIDIVGLTDAYIASLPNETLLQKRPRPGHPLHAVPLSYLARRGDISIFDGWQQAVAIEDCGLRERVKTLVDSKESFDFRHPLP
ncbi:MAG TPA: hypothetical protein VI759_01585 [Dehalococcoidia bacterium]|nr:hypothetical protein [Dehalococcoidia bacterium]